MKNFLIPMPLISIAQCESDLKSLQKNISDFPLSTYPLNDMKHDGPATLKRIWDLRVAIHNLLPEMNTKCQIIAREVFHKLRDLDDYISDVTIPVDHLDSADVDFQKEETPILNRAAYPAYSVVKDADTKPFQFQSGDIVLARGVSFFSAIITQLSNNKSHFSHSLILHVDKNTNKTHTIEAYVGKAVDKYDISFAMKNENVRLMVLRPRDKELGARAGDVAMQLVDSKAHYDYEMDFDDSSELSCVEVLSESYKRASSGNVNIPLLPAKLEHQNPDFISRMNLKNGDLITPDDLENDPRFELILDWKDVRLLRNSRYKDAVLSEIVRWHTDYNYSLQSTFKTYFAAHVLLPLRKSFAGPWLSKIPFLPVIDPHIPQKTLEVMTALDQVAQILLDEVISADREYQITHDRPMTNEQLRVALENIRQDDEIRDQDTSLFHDIFHKVVKAQ